MPNFEVRALSSSEAFTKSKVKGMFSYGPLRLGKDRAGTDGSIRVAFALLLLEAVSLEHELARPWCDHQEID